MSQASLRPYIRLVLGVYGKYPLRLISSISSQAQKDLGSVDFLLASMALGEMALKAMPGGSISPFWEPLTVTSTPHSSCL